jgi:diguanylate cyclase (GGDEF)-like protein/PAS domain S-box-containing protein
MTPRGGILGPASSMKGGLPAAKPRLIAWFLLVSGISIAALGYAGTRHPLSLWIILILGLGILGAALLLLLPAPDPKSGIASSPSKQEDFFDLLPLGAMILDPLGRMHRCNLMATEMLGASEESLKGVDWRNPEVPLLKLDGNPLPSEQAPFNLALETRERASAPLGIERPRDGDWIWVQMSVMPWLDEQGTIRNLLCTLEDVTQRKTAEAELAIQTFRDRLTSLPNRALFMERLSQALLRADRRQLTSAVLFLDLDRFKMVNDSLSHEAGDHLLVQVAKRIRGSLRPEDTVARIGGDDFVVLFEDIHSINDALRVAERIRASFEEVFTFHEHELYVTGSMGLAISTSSSTVPSELLRDAEVAMYRAKAKGDGSIEIFDPSMNAQALLRLQLESDLRHGLERNEFRLFYQPLVSLSTGLIEGWEALVRWQHPERGLVPPNDFIPAAEETGLIVPLGKWVLEEAVRQASIWRSKFYSDPPRLISVNISGRQFQQKDLVHTVTDVLDSSHFDPRCLKLEITESVMMRDPKASLEAMNALRGLDIHLVIDDFGTGYSSLSYLKRFPVDTLKVDKSFVDGLGKDSESTAIVKAVISLAKSLGMRVTAEGIETAEQLERLRALDCDQGQGYLFSRPVPAGAAEELLASGISW